MKCVARPGIRLELGIDQGDSCGMTFDSMIAKSS